MTPSEHFQNPIEKNHRSKDKINTPTHIYNVHDNPHSWLDTATSIKKYEVNLPL